MTILATLRFPRPAACFFGPTAAPRSKVANVRAGSVVAEASEAGLAPWSGPIGEPMSGSVNP